MASNFTQVTLRTDQMELVLNALELLTLKNLDSEDIEEICNLRGVLQFKLDWIQGK